MKKFVWCALTSQILFGCVMICEAVCSHVELETKAKAVRQRLTQPKADHPSRGMKRMDIVIVCSVVCSLPCHSQPFFSVQLPTVVGCDSTPISILRALQRPNIIYRVQSKTDGSYECVLLMTQDRQFFENFEVLSNLIEAMLSTLLV